jgi:hypothetical protein
MHLLPLLGSTPLLNDPNTTGVSDPRIPSLLTPHLRALDTASLTRHCKMQFLQAVPQAIVTDILSNYCTVVDLANMDAAYCSRDWRGYFLSLLDFATNMNVRFTVTSSVRSSFPHSKYPFCADYLRWKALRNVKTTGVLTISDCIGPSYSSQESVQEMVYRPNYPTHWHFTGPKATVSVTPITSELGGRPVLLERIRYIRDREGAESGSGYYNGRNPISAIISLIIKNASEMVEETLHTSIPWLDDANPVAEWNVPDDVKQRIFSIDGNHIQMVTMILQNRYPHCNTPPGHMHAYNGNKLSLNGLEFIGFDL